MKILVYSPKFYPSVGGLENLTLMLAKEFVNKGHEVKVVCFEKDNGIDCGVETYFSPSIVKQLQLFLWASVFYMPNISLKGIWLLLFNPFKTWVVSHNAWYGPVDAGQKSFNERFKLFLLKFARNISVSKSIAEYIPVPSTVIPNCYDATIFHNGYGKTRSNDVLFVGRLVSDKGIDVLMNACLLLWQKGLHFKLHIVGKGEMENWVLETIQKNNLESKVLMKGKLTGTVLASEMNAHTIMAVPSTWLEPFGIVALEGLACGCKVICSSGGGLPEAVGDFGSLFINGNVEELAHLIERSLSDTYHSNNQALENFLQLHHPAFVAAAYINVFQLKQQ